MASGLFTFVNGTPLSTGGLGPVLGALGGHRDRILLSVGLAGAALQAGAATLMPAGATDATDFPTATAGATGAVTGLVVDAAGDPAPNVLISYAPIPASATPVYLPGNYPAEIPAAITDELGVFNLPALPPGDYVVTAILISARANWRLTGTLQSVGVNAGETTKLPAPFSPPLKLK